MFFCSIDCNPDIHQSKLSLPTMLYKSHFNVSVILCFLVKLYFGMNSDGISRGDHREEKQHKSAVLAQDPPYSNRKEESEWSMIPEVPPSRCEVFLKESQTAV